MKILKWLSVSDRFAKTYLDTQLAPLGINSSQHMYLLKVCDQPGILQDTFLESFYVHPSNIVRTIALLEKNGFLTKEPCEADKRTCHLYPTPKALEIADSVRAICSRTEAILTEGFTEEEAEAFSRLLHRMGQRMAEELHISRVGDEFDV